MDTQNMTAQAIGQKLEIMTAEIANINSLIKKLYYSQQKARELEPIEIKGDDPAAEVEQSPPLAKPPAGNIPYDRLKGAITTLATTKGRQVALDVLQQFGVATAKDLDEGSYHDCYLAVKDATL